MSKLSKYGQSPSATNQTIEVSNILHETNSILYEQEAISQITVPINNSFNVLCEVDCDQETLVCSDKMADKSGGPTNADIIAMLTK